MLRSPLPLPSLPFDRRCRVPESLLSVTRVRPGAEVPGSEVGVPQEWVEDVWACFESLYASGIHPAIAVCLRHRGAVLLDRSIGHSHGNGPDAPAWAEKTVATPDTPFCLASASKPYAAMAIHALDERELLHVDDPVVRYLPGFDRHGKADITIRQVLTHHAGVPTIPPEALDPGRLTDHEGIIAELAELEPHWEPGTTQAYHAVTGGFLLGEIVRRVSGRDLRSWVDDHIAGPLGLRWTRYGVRPSELHLVAEDEFTGPPVPPGVSGLLAQTLGAPLPRIVEMLKDPRVLTGVVPAANLIATADELCRFYEMLRCGGELDGVRVFAPETVRRATIPQGGFELDRSLGGLPFRYSMGFMLGGAWLGIYGPGTPNAFGHLGLTNVLGWADPDREISCAILTSGKPVLYFELFHLIEALRRICLARATPNRRSQR